MPNNFGGDQQDPDYNPGAAQKASRKQRVKRMQMKKQAQKKPRAKKTVPLAEVAWHVRAQTLPLGLFHTTVGPIIGHVEQVTGPSAGVFNLRLWAPAVIRVGLPPEQSAGTAAINANIWASFHPIALVETYLDLSTATPFGRSPVPQAIVSSYEAYFAKVAAGEYSFARLTVPAEHTMPCETPIDAAESERRSPSWPGASDPHTWLTRKVYGLSEDEVIERDDPRRVIVKRAFFGWSYDASVDKVARDFDFNEADVRRVYDVIETLSDEDKTGAKKVLGTRSTFPNRPLVSVDETGSS